MRLALIVAEAELLDHEQDEEGRHAVVAEPLPQFDQEENGEGARSRGRRLNWLHAGLVRRRMVMLGHGMGPRAKTKRARRGDSLQEVLRNSTRSSRPRRGKAGIALAQEATVKTNLLATIGVCLGVLTSGGVAWSQSITYGPILGRGVTADQMIVKWGTGATNDPTSAAFRVKGAGSFTTVTGTARKITPSCSPGSPPTPSTNITSARARPERDQHFATCPQTGRADGHRVLRRQPLRHERAPEGRRPDRSPRRRRWCSRAAIWRRRHL